MVSSVGQEVERNEIKRGNKRYRQYSNRLGQDVNALAISIRTLFVETVTLSQPTQASYYFLAHS